MTAAVGHDESRTVPELRVQGLLEVTLSMQPLNAIPYPLDPDGGQDTAPHRRPLVEGRPAILEEVPHADSRESSGSSAGPSVASAANDVLLHLGVL